MGYMPFVKPKKPKKPAASPATPATASTGVGAPAGMPGNAFSPEMLQGMYQQSLQALTNDESNRQAGIQQSMNARGVAGPNVAAITAPGALAHQRGALGAGNLAAQEAGLNLGLGQYQAQTGRQSSNNQAAQFGANLANQQSEFGQNLGFQQSQANRAQQNWQTTNDQQQAQQNPPPVQINPWMNTGNTQLQASWFNNNGVRAGGGLALH